ENPDVQILRESPTMPEPAPSPTPGIPEKPVEPAPGPAAQPAPQPGSQPAPQPAPQPQPAPEARRKITIAIDPGHRGEDPGAIGPRGTQEKDVVLAIARKLKALIDSEPGMRAMLTRNDDHYVPLAARVQKARQVQADFFISIHADAFTAPSVRGSSVF